MRSKMSMLVWKVKQKWRQLTDLCDLVVIVFFFFLFVQIDVGLKNPRQMRSDTISATVSVLLLELYTSRYEFKNQQSH